MGKEQSRCGGVPRAAPERRAAFTILHGVFRGAQQPAAKLMNTLCCTALASYRKKCTEHETENNKSLRDRQIKNEVKKTISTSLCAGRNPSIAHFFGDDA